MTAYFTEFLIHIFIRYKASGQEAKQAGHTVDCCPWAMRWVRMVVVAGSIL